MFIYLNSGTFSDYHTNESTIVTLFISHNFAHTEFYYYIQVSCYISLQNFFETSWQNLQYQMSWKSE